MLAVLETLLGITYFLCAVVIAIYSSSFFIMIVLYLVRRNQSPSAPAVPDDQLLSVTLQLPIYNERHVVDRLIDAIGALDYPRDKLCVQVLDDSTDETTAILENKVAVWQAKGLAISLIRRPDRVGYKAGALEFGLQQITTDCVGIFDADFVPAPDYLRRVMPHFNADPAIALVQSRLSQLNLDYNLLTRAQTLAMDQHFAVEQVARSRSDLPMAMNGTGGIWRRQVIEDAGGWTAETLTEDLDLSYRAFLKGWRFRYVVDVAVPGEVPPQLTAYKVQQARWAKGSTQCLKKHSGALLRSDLRPLQKAMGLLHLGQYAIQPFVLVLFMLTPPILSTDWLRRLPLAPLGVASLAPLIFVSLGQIALYRDWYRRLLYFPVLTLITTGMMLSNTRAVVEGWMGWGGNVFRRTPKFSVERRDDPLVSGRYALRPDWTTLGELLLGAYAVAGLVIAMLHARAMIPYMLVYVISFGLLSAWSLWQTAQIARVQP